MKNLKKIIATLGMVIASFFFKVKAELMVPPTQGVAPFDPTLDNPTSWTWTPIIKIVEMVLIVAAFIVGIIKFIKIRKIEDKSLRIKKRWKVIIITLVLIGIIFLLANFVIWILMRSNG